MTRCFRFSCALMCASFVLAACGGGGSGSAVRAGPSQGRPAAVGSAALSFFMPAASSAHEAAGISRFSDAIGRRELVQCGRNANGLFAIQRRRRVAVVEYDVHDDRHWGEYGFGYAQRPSAVRWNELERRSDAVGDDRSSGRHVLSSGCPGQHRCNKRHVHHVAERHLKATITAASHSTPIGAIAYIREIANGAVMFVSTDSTTPNPGGDSAHGDFRMMTAAQPCRSSKLDVRCQCGRYCRSKLSERGVDA